MKYLGMIEHLFSQEGYLEKKHDEYLSNLLALRDINLATFANDSKDLATKTKEIFEAKGIREINGIDVIEYLEHLDDLDIFEKFETKSLATGWRAKIYELLGKSIFNPNLIPSKEDMSLPDMVGLLSGEGLEIDEVARNCGIDYEEDRIVEDAKRLIEAYVETLDSKGKWQFKTNEARGYRFHRGNNDNDFFEAANDATGIYISLLFLGDLVDELNSPTKVRRMIVEFLQLDPNKNHTERFKKIFKKIGYKRRKPKGLPIS